MAYVSFAGPSADEAPGGTAWSNLEGKRVGFGSRRRMSDRTLDHAGVFQRLRPYGLQSRVSSPTVIVIAVGLATLWFAFVHKMSLTGFEWPSLIVSGIVALVAVVFFVSLAIKRQLTWPLMLLLFFWGWIFVRDLINGNAVPSILLGGAIVVISVYASTLSEKNLTLAHLTFPVGFLVASIALTLVHPSSAFLEAGSSDFLGQLPFGQYFGFAHHPNDFGPVMALGLLIIFSQKTLTVWLKVLAGFFLLGLFASGSDGSIVAFVGALFFIALHWDKIHGVPGKLRWRSITAVTATLVFGVWSVALIATSGFRRFSTGRTAIWESYLEPAQEAGLFGFGHFDEETSADVIEKFTLLYLDPHNMWLTTQITGGYFGSAIHLAFWVAVVISIWKMAPSTSKTLAIGLAVFLLVYGNVESLLFTGFRVYFPMFGLLLALLVSDKVRACKQRKPALPHAPG